jgi:multicomponent Na+:H+ antiporter subunit C
MVVWLAIGIGCVYAAAIYMILRRSLVKVIIGLALLGHATNLLIFSQAPLRTTPPLVEADGQPPEAAAVADPLPQALILTAIVIGFGVLAFALALFNRAVDAVGFEDLDDLKATDA